jgi:hypothetical protein
LLRSSDRDERLAYGRKSAAEQAHAVDTTRCHAACDAQTARRCWTALRLFICDNLPKNLRNQTFQTPDFSMKHIIDGARIKPRRVKAIKGLTMRDRPFNH